jgi:hypothetical protein
MQLNKTTQFFPGSEWETFCNVQSNIRMEIQSHVIIEANKNEKLGRFKRNKSMHVHELIRFPILILADKGYYRSNGVGNNSANG